MRTIMKYILVTIGIMFIIPFTVKADCSYEREAELSRIAANVQFSYTYTADENGEPVFTVHITNVTGDIYVRDNFGNIFRTSESSKVYEPGQTITYNLISNDGNCPGQELLTQYVTLPFFNPFYKEQECQDNPSFKYCQIWANTQNITKEQFDTELNSYTTPKSATKIDEKQNVWETIKNIFVQNYYIFIILLVVIGLIIIYKKRFGDVK